MAASGAAAPLGVSGPASSLQQVQHHFGSLAARPCSEITVDEFLRGCEALRPLYDVFGAFPGGSFVSGALKQDLQRYLDEVRRCTTHHPAAASTMMPPPATLLGWIRAEAGIVDAADATKASTSDNAAASTQERQPPAASGSAMPPPPMPASNAVGHTNGEEAGGEPGSLRKSQRQLRRGPSVTHGVLWLLRSALFVSELIWLLRCEESQRHAVSTPALVRQAYMHVLRPYHSLVVSVLVRAALYLVPSRASLDTRFAFPDIATEMRELTATAQAISVPCEALQGWYKANGLNYDDHSPLVPANLALLSSAVASANAER